MLTVWPLALNFQLAIMDGMRSASLALNVGRIWLVACLSIALGVGAVRVATQVLHYRCMFLGGDPESSSPTWLCADGSEYLPLAVAVGLLAAVTMLYLLATRRQSARSAWDGRPLR